jgi:hypothetical protein
MIGDRVVWMPLEGILTIYDRGCNMNFNFGGVHAVMEMATKAQDNAPVFVTGNAQ